MTPMYLEAVREARFLMAAALVVIEGSVSPKSRDKTKNMMRLLTEVTDHIEKIIIKDKSNG